MGNSIQEVTLGSVPPKNDIVFKRLFGVKGNEGILKDFLESILDIKIESLELDLSTELQPDFYEGKKSVVDVRTRLSNGTEVNIEMQMKAFDYSEQRCLYYWSKIYSNTAKKGRDYKELQKTICIWFLNEDVYHDFEEFESKWRIVNDKRREINHFNEFEIHVIELQKFRNDDTIKPSKKNFWLWFLDYTNREMVKMACISNERIREAREQLDKITSDRELMNRIIAEEIAEMDEIARRNREKEEMERVIAEGREKGLAEGREKGLAEGREKGLAEEKIIIVKKMKEKGIEIETIAEITGMSKEEIEKS